MAERQSARCAALRRFVSRVRLRRALYSWARDPVCMAPAVDEASPAGARYGQRTWALRAPALPRHLYRRLQPYQLYDAPTGEPNDVPILQESSPWGHL